MKSLSPLFFRIIVVLGVLLTSSSLFAQDTEQVTFNIEELIKSNKLHLANSKLDSVLTSRPLSKTEQAKFYLKKANIFSLLKIQDSAVYYLKSCIKSARADKDQDVLLKAYSNLGILLNQNNAPEDALEYFYLYDTHLDSLVDTYQKEKRKLTSNYNLGLTYYNLNGLDSALYYLDKSLFLANKVGDTLLASKVYGLKSQINFKASGPWQKELKKATSLSLALKDSTGILKAYLTAAEFHLEEASLSKSVFYLKKAKAYLESGRDNFYLLRNYYKIKYRQLKGLRDFNSSLRALENYNLYNAKIDSLRQRKAVSLFDERLKLYENDLKVSRLMLQKEKEIKRLIIISSGLGFVLLILIGLLFYKSKKIKFNNKLFKLNLVYDENLAGDLRDDMAKRELFDTIKKEIIENRLFLKHDLSLVDVANLVNSNTNYVSGAINSITQSNFRSYINKKRVAYSKTMIQEKIQSSSGYVDFEDIAQGSGFNSVTQFYRVFKQMTGLTPRQYKNRLSSRE